MKKQNYDVVVIGAGSGGLTSAAGFAKVGKSVLLIEREHMGGECTNSGCVPSKTLLHAAKVGQTGEEAFRTVRATVDHILAEETPEAFEKLGITVVMGEAIFNSCSSVQVGEDIYYYKHAVVATGSSPRLTDIEGLDPELILTNQNLFNITDAPKNLLVIGGGPIGMEMAEAMARLGSKVTIAERSTFAKLEDAALRPLIKKRFLDLGITILENTSVNKVSGNIAHLNTDGQMAELAFDKLLLAIGRVPNLPSGLETAGIKYTEHGLTVNSQYRTSNKAVYAVGDVADRLKFTHQADDSARQVVARVVSLGWLRVKKNKSIPKVTYTTPEIAQVGLHWQQAVDEYSEDRLMRIEVPFSQNDRAITDDATDGMLVVVALRLSGQVLGAHIYGPRAGEILAIFSLAIDHKISLWKIQKHIFAYPTYSLIAKKAGDQFVGRQFGDLKTDLKRLVKRSTPKITAAVFWLSLFVAFQWYRVGNDLSYQDVLFQLLDFLQMTAWGPIIYILAYAVRPLIFFPATLMTALSGALFGPVLGIVYTIIGENASANLAYWVGRFFGKDLKLENTIIGNWITTLRENTFGTILFMRLAYFPFDLTNYAAGVVNAKWHAYFIATLIGIMPGLTVFVLFGASFQDGLSMLQEEGLNFKDVDTNILGISVVIFVVSLLVSRYLKKWRASS